MTDETRFPDGYQDFDLEQKKLERRRRIAEQLIATPMAEPTTAAGNINFQGVFNRFLNQTQGNRDLAAIEAQDKLLSANQAQNTRDVMEGLSKRGSKAEVLPDDQEGPTRPSVPLSQEEEANRRIGIMGQGLGNPTLRQTLQAQIGQEMDYPNQERVRQENAAQRAHQVQLAAAERKALQDDRQAHQVQQDALYRRTAAMVGAGQGGGQGKPPSGYRWAEDGTLAPITGGPADKSNATKPLTAKQLETQRGFMDLESSLANYEAMLNDYDFQGKSATSPKSRAALEGAYTDMQMKLKTLYELGAPQAGDLKLLSQAIPNPTSIEGTLKGAAFGADPFKARLGETKKLLANSKANFETQFNRPTPAAAANPDIQPARVTSREEWAALPAGTPYITADGKKGVR